MRKSKLLFILPLCILLFTGCGSKADAVTQYLDGKIEESDLGKLDKEKSASNMRAYTSTYLVKECEVMVIDKSNEDEKDVSISINFEKDKKSAQKFLEEVQEIFAEKYGELEDTEEFETDENKGVTYYYGSRKENHASVMYVEYAMKKKASLRVNYYAPSHEPMLRDKEFGMSKDEVISHEEEMDDSGEYGIIEDMLIYDDIVFMRADASVGYQFDKNDELCEIVYVIKDSSDKSYGIINDYVHIYMGDSIEKEQTEMANITRYQYHGIDVSVAQILQSEYMDGSLSVVVEPTTDE